MKILLATHNPAKVKRYTNLLNHIPNLELVSLSDINVTDIVDEPHENSKDNSIHKAKTYSKKTNLITIAIDEAVTTNFLPENEQPGVYVRRLKKSKKSATDKEVLEFWKDTFTKFPQKDKEFIWDFNITCYNPINKNTMTINVVQKNSVTINFAKKINKGYPMSSFLCSKNYKKPFIELKDGERTQIDRENFNNFIIKFTAWIKKQ